jgi:hypothetical protein
MWIRAAGHPSHRGPDRNRRDRRRCRVRRGGDDQGPLRRHPRGQGRRAPARCLVDRSAQPVRRGRADRHAARDHSHGGRPVRRRFADEGGRRVGCRPIRARNRPGQSPPRPAKPSW